LANPNIFQQYLRPAKTMAEFGAEMDTREENQLTLAAKRQAVADDAALRQAYQQSGGDPYKIRQALLGSGNVKALTAYDAAQLERQKTQAEIAKSQASARQSNVTADKTVEEIKYAKADRHARKIALIQTPQDIAAYLDEGIAEGIFPASQRDSMLQRASQFPTIEAFKQAATQNAIPVLDAYRVGAENSRAAATLAEQKRGHDITAEGQRLLDARAREANRLKAQEIGVTREGIVGKKIQDVELKLQDDYRTESKGFGETATAMKKVLGAIETADKNPGSALAAGTAFMKILDPNSVVRETELGMALNASGWFDRATNIVNTMQRGRTMTKEQQANLKAAANDLFEEAKAAQREVDAAYHKRATDYGADPKRVIVDRGQGKQRPAPPPTLADRVSQIPAGRPTAPPAPPAGGATVSNW